MSRQYGVPIAVHTEGDFAGLPPETAPHMYRVLQESLTNVVKHAGASEVSVRAVRGTQGVHLTVDDDGRGLERDAPQAPGLGLTSMRERAALMGGTFALTASPLGGVRVAVHVPIDA
ncbi:MAG: sensor histidine kinase [Luteitalea sp.]